MSTTLRKDIYSLSAPGISVDQVQPPVPDPLGPARYSCLYWIDHLIDYRSSPSNVPEVENARFLDSNVDEDFSKLAESDVFSIGSASFDEDIYDDDQLKTASIKLSHMVPFSKEAEEDQLESSPEDKPGPEAYTAANSATNNGTLDTTKDFLPGQPTPQSETSVNNTCDNPSSNSPPSQNPVPGNHTLETPIPVQQESSSHSDWNDNTISSSLLTQNTKARAADSPKISSHESEDNCG